MREFVMPGMPESNVIGAGASQSASAASSEYRMYNAWEGDTMERQGNQSTAHIDQEAAMEELRERYAHGALPLEEFRRLMGAVMVTTDPAELQAIIGQLPPNPSGNRALAQSVASYPTNQPYRGAGRPLASGSSITAVFGSVDRRNVFWELGPELDVTALFGEVKLDVRMARLTAEESVLRLNAIFGEVSVIVPAGMRVYVDSSARFGEVSLPGRRSIEGIVSRDSLALGNDKSGFTLRIEATATFGEVKIRTA